MVGVSVGVSFRLQAAMLSTITKLNTITSNFFIFMFSFNLYILFIMLSSVL